MANEYETLAQSAARSADFNSLDQTNSNARGAIVVLDATSVTSGSLVATIQGKDLVSAKYYTILASAPILTNGTTRLSVYPGLTAATNAAVNYVLPQTWRVNVVAASGTATYSIGASLIE